MEDTHNMLRLQTPLDERYTGAPQSELAARIEAAKAALGDRGRSSSATTTSATR